MKRATSFKKVVACHTGDFGVDLNEKMRIWIEANHGIFKKDLSGEVTHLEASKKAWKQNHPLVKEARRMRSVYIVSYDWLEDSLLKVPLRALPPEKYMFEQAKLRLIKKVTNRAKTSAPVEVDTTKKITIPREKCIETSGSPTGIEFDKAIAEFEQDMNSAGFHPYSDSTGFVYIVTLLRHDILKSRFEKYKLKVGATPPKITRDILPGIYTMLHLYLAPEPFSICPIVGFKLSHSAKRSSCVHLAEPWAMCLQLFESDQQPHTYACYMQYTRPGVQKKVVVLAPPGSTWSFAWTMFEKFFRKKVGTSWNGRTGTGAEINLDGNTQQDTWHYVAPRFGEPEGLRSASNFMGQIKGSAEEKAQPETQRPEESVCEDVKIHGCDTFMLCEEEEIDDTHHP